MIFALEYKLCYGHNYDPLFNDWNIMTVFFIMSVEIYESIYYTNLTLRLNGLFGQSTHQHC